MAKITAFLETSREVHVDPEMAWSLLGSAWVWSLRPGLFAFDAESADSQTIRCLLQATSTGIGHGVLTLCSERPDLAATWAVGASGEELTFSARPHRRGAVVGAALKFLTDRGSAYYLKRSWDRMLGVWLARACEVLEGRQPWPASMPPDVRRACAAPPPLTATETVTDSVLVAAL